MDFPNFRNLVIGKQRCLCKQFEIMYCNLDVSYESQSFLMETEVTVFSDLRNRQDKLTLPKI